MKASFSYQEIRESINKLRNIGEAKKYKTSFLVKSGNSLIPIDQDLIAYFFASNKWVYLVKNNGTEHLVNYSLGEIEALLDPTVFFRIARNYLVKKAAIVKLSPYYKGQVTVDINPKNKESIVVSQARTGDLKQWLSDE